MQRRHFLFTLALATTSAHAGEADVVNATITRTGDTFSVSATIKSNDKGWDYYADRFEVVALDGTVLGTRILHHPHETEQPFTRSLNGLAIPANIKHVTVRASMKPDGAGGETVELTVPH